MKVQNANTGKWHSPRTEFFANTDIRKNAENAKHDKKTTQKKTPKSRNPDYHKPYKRRKPRHMKNPTT